MKTRRIISMIMVLALVLGMGTMAFAEEVPAPGVPHQPGNQPGDQEDADWTHVEFKKSITTISNDGEKHPAETFNFTITPVSGVNEQGNPIDPIPAFDPSTFNIALNEGAGQETILVELPEFNNLGTYVYKVVETASDTAGMVYDTTEYTFTVVVLNDGHGQLKRLILKDATTKKKTDVFMNKYKAGNLIVSKKITGNNANFAEKFPVKVTLTAPAGKVINSTITVGGHEGTLTKTGDGTSEIVLTFDVTNESNVIINNIPYDVTYVVEETDLKGYTVTYDNKTGSIVGPTKTAKITNDLSRDIATGINLDNLPYIILLAGAGIGIGALVLRKRKNIEY